MTDQEHHHEQTEPETARVLRLPSERVDAANAGGSAADE